LLQNIPGSVYVTGPSLHCQAAADTQTVQRSHQEAVGSEYCAELICFDTITQSVSLKQEAPHAMLGRTCIWNENPATAVRIPGHATIPLGNLGQVVYSHCLPSFSAPRNWGTKGSFRRL